MLFRAAISALALLAAAPVLSQASTAASAETLKADAALAALFDRYDKAQLQRSPMLKANRGVRDADYGKWEVGS